MVVAAPPRSPEFRSFHVQPLRHPRPIPSGRRLHQVSPVHREQLSLPLCCKNDSNVFNHIQPLFSAVIDADPLLSTPSSLFSPKQGLGAITMVPKSSVPADSSNCIVIRKIRTLCTFFATSTLCFHHFMNSLRKKHPG